MDKAITFCATGKTGLGHLRRVTNVAWALRERTPGTPLRLLTNSTPAGLTVEEVGLYRHIDVVPRPRMAAHIAARPGGPVVVDTAVLPELHTVDAPLCLILRETLPEKLGRFRLAEGRPWDLVLLPNPRAEWWPDGDVVLARRMEAVGWIYRPPPPTALAAHLEETGTGRDGPPRVLIATGGGGSGDKWATMRAALKDLIRQLRAAAEAPFEVVQALGPRASEDARIAGADGIVRTGPHLPEAFAQADLVITTSGYNSVLELACIDVPVLLLSIAPTYDDQEKRARHWGAHLGLDHLPDDPGRSVRWMADTLAARRRRRPVDIGPSGAATCARLLEEFLG